MTNRSNDHFIIWIVKLYADGNADCTYHFFFYSNEGDEPRDIHIRSEDNEAKFWLQLQELVWNQRYNERQIRRIERHIQDNLAYLIESWDEFFKDQDDDHGTDAS